jgi:hypothetical protein
MSQNQTQAAIFAAEHAKNAAIEALTTIKANSKAAEKVTKIALGVSMPHQIAFILSLVPLQFPTTGGFFHIVFTWLESLTLIGGSVGIPVGLDYLILICIRSLTARASSRIAKKVSGMVILFPVGVSGTVNVLAPAPWLIKVLFGVVVVLIPLSQLVRVVSQSPDFRKIEAMELDIQRQVSQATEVAPANGVTRQGTPAQQARRRAANARRLFAANPGLTVAELAAAAGVGRNTAKRIIDTYATETLAEMEEELAE